MLGQGSWGAPRFCATWSESFSACCDQFLLRWVEARAWSRGLSDEDIECHVPPRAVLSPRVVVLSLRLHLLPGIRDREESVLVQTFLSEAAVEGDQLIPHQQSYRQNVGGEGAQRRLTYRPTMMSCAVFVESDIEPA